MPEKKDFSSTLNLPKTEFPMKADLAKREPLILDYWREIEVYAKLSRRRGKKGDFLLHDGPPYANGPIHIGHALNKILKDMAVKSRALLGYGVSYRPGWDCHGLPIETELLKQKKVDKRSIKDIPGFRAEAEAFAERFIAIQREDFKRLGIFGEWDDPYKTMARDYEAKVLRAFRLLLKDGAIVQGTKPVHWCFNCESALAEAEIEYKDKTSPSVYVAFPVLEHADSRLRGAEALIWTTTPWTLPANTGLAFHPELAYVLVQAKDAQGKERKLLMAEARLEAAAKNLGLEIEGPPLWKASGKEAVRGLVYQRPFRPSSPWAFTAEYVTAEDGTGIVHTAPGHGEDDFRAYQADEKPDSFMLCPVDASGRFTPDAPEFAGIKVFPEGNAAVLERLAQKGSLLGHQDIQHSYPHCWRCKKPVIFRATPQWFLRIGHKGGGAPELRERLLKAIAEARWFPPEGRNRISAMVEGRPDWCLSRQRVWGTPITVLWCAKCSHPLHQSHPEVLEAIEKRVAEEGDGFWFQDWGRDIDLDRDWKFLPADLRCGSCRGRVFRREPDILDVWMDSGASWLAVVGEERSPCDLYLEGSDQHRGWFQSSLVLAVGLTGKAPYKSVLTHGFVLDERGHAMHKSAGNVVAPQEVVGKSGADVLRLWVALSDYKDDVRISAKLMEVPAEAYRKIRNTMRYLLGNLDGFSPSKDAAPCSAMPPLERRVLHELAAMEKAVRAAYEAYAFRDAARALADFCNLVLSAFYMDARKDALYTLRTDHPTRRAAQTAMHHALERLCCLAAPILSFTCEEAWREMRRMGLASEESVFLRELAEPPEEWSQSPQAAARWEALLSWRARVLKKLEEARAAGMIGSGLQAQVTLLCAAQDRAVLCPDPGRKEESERSLAELFLVSSVKVELNGGSEDIRVEPAPGRKCARCWRYQTDVGSNSAFAELCGRCVEQLPAPAGR